MGVEDVAGHHHVGVGEREEGQQRLGVAGDSRRIGRAASRLVVAVVTSRRSSHQPTDDGAKAPRATPTGGRSLGRARMSAVPISEAGHAHRQVEHGERGPAPLALEDAGLAAHHRERHGDSPTSSAGEAVEPEHVPTQRGRPAGAPARARATRGSHAAASPLDLRRRRGARPRSGGRRWPAGRAGARRPPAAAPSARRARRTPPGREPVRPRSVKAYVATFMTAIATASPRCRAAGHAAARGGRYPSSSRPRA